MITDHMEATRRNLQTKWKNAFVAEERRTQVFVRLLVRKS
jgi:hypothetical protein